MKTIFQVGGSVSVSGGYGGFEASVRVDVSKFEESEETTKEFGEEQLTYKIGGATLPEPIQVTLLGIEETLKPKFWSNLEKLKKNLKQSCKGITRLKLRKFFKNMAEALKEYPQKMGVTRAKGIHHNYTLFILRTFIASWYTYLTTLTMLHFLI